MNKESIVKEKINYQAIGEPISNELAAKMIKNHCDKYVGDSKTYIIGRNIIETVLAQPGCVGFRFHEAINESGEKTLVYFGIDENGKNIHEYSSVDQNGKIVVTEVMGNDKILPGAQWW
jgi:hypothetical protein